MHQGRDHMFEQTGLHTVSQFELEDAFFLKPVPRVDMSSICKPLRVTQVSSLSPMNTLLPLDSESLSSVKIFEFFGQPYGVQKHERAMAYESPLGLPSTTGDINRR